MFSLICVWINGWANSPEGGGLRRRRAHYDVIVMNETGIFWDNWVVAMAADAINNNSINMNNKQVLVFHEQ